MRSIFKEVRLEKHNQTLTQKESKEHQETMNDTAREHENGMFDENCCHLQLKEYFDILSVITLFDHSSDLH